MSRIVAAEVVADAVLIGRYFGSSSATSALSRAVAAASTSAPSRGSTPVTEGDGPGLRTMTSSTGAVMGGMSAPGASGPGAVRFMSMFGRMHAADYFMEELPTTGL